MSGWTVNLIPTCLASTVWLCDLVRADAHHVQVVEGQQVLLLSVEVDVAAGEDHEVVLPGAGQSCLADTECGQHSLEAACSDQTLLLFELSAYLSLSALWKQDSRDAHQGVEGVRSQVEGQRRKRSTVERGHFYFGQLGYSGVWLIFRIACVLLRLIMPKHTLHFALNLD